MRTMLTALAICLLFAGAAGAQTKPGTAACAAMKTFKVPGLTLEITMADWVAAGSSPPAPVWDPAAPASTLKLPAFCRVDGVIDRRTGADGKRTGSDLRSLCPTTGTAGFFSRAAAP